MEWILSKSRPSFAGTFFLFCWHQLWDLGSVRFCWSRHGTIYTSGQSHPGSYWNYGTSRSNVTSLVGQELETWGYRRKLIGMGLRFRTPCNSCHRWNFSIFQNTLLYWLHWIYSWPEANLDNQPVFLWLPPSFAFAHSLLL